jgi:hypothetical protein
MALVEGWQCPRCGRNFTEPLWTVPLHLPATENKWSNLCAECFRAVLGIEPPEQFSRQHLLKLRRRYERR